MAEPFPAEFYLARCRMERLDLLQELQGVKAGEEERHRLQLLSGEPHRLERKSPFGALPPEPRRPTPGATAWPPAATAGGGSAPSAPKAQEQPKRHAGLLLMELPQDPTTLPNEHIARRDAIEEAIAVQQRQLAASRSEGALLRSLGLDVDCGMPAHKWDRLPTANGVGMSESQAQFFPRSAGMVRECGNFKDPKLCRPYDFTYRHREAMCRQKHLLTKQ